MIANLTAALAVFIAFASFAARVAVGYDDPLWRLLAACSIVLFGILCSLACLGNAGKAPRGTQTRPKPETPPGPSASRVGPHTLGKNTHAPPNDIGPDHRHAEAKRAD